MQLGFHLPQIGSAASLNSISVVGKRAEELGYDSLWVLDRLLYPINPQTPYGHTPDGSLPEQYKQVFDPVAVLTFVAARTDRIGLGTSVLDMPYYNPVMLARQLSTLDVLSGGRLRVGLGQGWSKDEHDAAGATLKDRGRRADEFVAVLKAVWTTNPVKFHGKYFHVPESIIQPKPVQKPHPPIYLATFTAAGLKRAARLADGWMPAGLSIDKMRERLGELRSLARNVGRNPAELRVVLVANLSVRQQPLKTGREMFSGDLQQIGNDVEAVREFGIDELILAPNFSPDSQSEDGFLRNLERLRNLV